MRKRFINQVKFHYQANLTDEETVTLISQVKKMSMNQVKFYCHINLTGEETVYESN